MKSRKQIKDIFDEKEIRGEGEEWRHNVRVQVNLGKAKSLRRE